MLRMELSPVRIRLLSVAVLGCALAFVPGFSARTTGATEELLLPEVTTLRGRTVSVGLTLGSDRAVDGVQAVADWDSTVARGVNIVAADGAGEPLEDADFVITRIHDGYFVLSVVMGFDAAAGKLRLIPAGRHTVAELTLAGVAEDRSTELVFRDGVYAIAGVGTELDNLVVIEGVSIGVGEGLIVTPGEIRVERPPSAVFRIGDVVAQQGQTTQDVFVLLDAADPVEGYFVGVGHDPGEAHLLGIDLQGTDALAAGAEFVAADLDAPDGGSISVVLDFEAPFEGQTLSGEGVSIARFVYEATNLPVLVGVSECEDDDLIAELSVDIPLEFEDDKFGSPAQPNRVDVGGVSERPVLNDGTLTFPPLVADAVSCASMPAFACGGELVAAERDAETGEFLRTDDGSFVYVRGANDALIPDDKGVPAPLEGHPGQPLPVSFYYMIQPGESVDEADPQSVGKDFDDIQGLSISVTHDRGLVCPGTYSLRGSITEALDAEFVSLSWEDDDPELGGGELVIAILVDAAPPFDGRTLPPTTDFLKIIDVTYRIAEAADCGDDSSISFVDGNSGNQAVPTNNVLSIQNRSIPVEPAFRYGADVDIVSIPAFLRGDCNYDFVAGDEEVAVDLADAQAVISFIFLEGDARFRPPCLDSCDSDDDGRIGLADAIKVLMYVFEGGDPPPAPGPTELGPDPTPDKLDCGAGRFCN